MTELQITLFATQRLATWRLGFSSGTSSRQRVSNEVLLAASHCSAGKVNLMVIVASLIHFLSLLEIFVSDADTLGEMNDLGTLMLGGFVLAVMTAIALTIIRLRIRDKKPESPQFISINSREED